MDNFSGKTAVITGAASGIGLEMARSFGAAGMNLVLADIEAPVLETVADELREAGYPVSSHVVDVRELEQIQALEASAREQFGNVHLLCNNAGVGTGGPIAGIDNIEHWRWTIDIDLWGVIYGCKVFLPAMVEHGERAHIVNTASMAGLLAMPFMGSYNISKYGVVALSETMSCELQMTGANVGVSVLCPAWVATGIAQSGRNLPADMREQTELTPEAQAAKSMVEAAVDGGISPTVIADLVVDAVRNDEFWILSHEEMKPAVVNRANEIVTGINPSFGGIQ